MAWEGDKTGIVLKLFIIGIILIITYLLIMPLFILSMFIIFIYFFYKIGYPIIRKHSTPSGRRIKHKELKGYIEQKYGKEGGKDVYKEVVDVLRRKGYY